MLMLKELVLPVSHLPSGTLLHSTVLDAQTDSLPIQPTTNASAPHQLPTLTATTNVLLAMNPDTGTPTAGLVFTAPADTSLMLLPLPVFALLQLPTLMPAQDALLAMHLTSGIQLLKHARAAPRTSIGTLHLKNASAALKASPSILLTSSALVLQTTLTMTYLPRSASNATALLSGIQQTLDALAATEDQLGTLLQRPACALNRLHSLTKEKDNALNAPTTSPSGTEEPVSPALNTPTMMLNQRLAQSAQKALSTTPPKGHAQSLLDDYSASYSILFAHY